MINNKELFSAYIQFNSEFQGMKADGTNPYFKSTYITLDGILNTVRPILAKYGLAILQNAYSEDDGTICVKSILIHQSGQFFETGVLKMKPAKQDPQILGSHITYMKRYNLGALLGICESIDDDGNKATFPNGYSKKEKLTKKQMQQETIDKNDTSLISEDQLKKLWALTSGQVDVARAIIEKYGYGSSKEIQKKDFNSIIDEIEKALFS